MKYLKSCTLLAIVVLLSVNINSQAAQVYSDDFSGAGVHESFQWQNEPADWSIVDGWLHMEGAYGGNLWCTDESTRLYQEIGDEDFEIETHMKYAWAGGGVAGLAVKSPSDDNWIMMKLWARDGGEGQIQFQKKCLEPG